MRYYWHIESLGVLQCTPHKVTVSHRLAIIGKGYSAGIPQIPKLGETFSLRPFRNTCNRVDSTRAFCSGLSEEYSR